jgi:hypothetical protein
MTWVKVGTAAASPTPWSWLGPETPARTLPGVRLGVRLRCGWGAAGVRRRRPARAYAEIVELESALVADQSCWHEPPITSRSPAPRWNVLATRPPVPGRSRNRRRYPSGTVATNGSTSTVRTVSHRPLALPPRRVPEQQLEQLVGAGEPTRHVLDPGPVVQRLSGQPVEGRSAGLSALMSNNDACQATDGTPALTPRVPAPVGWPLPGCRRRTLAVALDARPGPGLGWP